jgi:hypothetical protein
MTMFVANHESLKQPRLVAAAMMADRIAMIACQTIGRTTNPLLLGIMLASGLVSWLRHGEAIIPSLPDFD